MSLNGWIDGKVLEILQACGVELPGGDGDTLRTIAQAWDGMAGHLDTVGRAMDAAIAGVDERGWHGDARTAFEKHWRGQRKIVDDIAGDLRQAGAGLRAYADDIDGINKSIIDICVQIAEMEVAGAALSLFTGFVSDLVANTAVAVRIAKIVDLVRLFTSAAEKVAQLLERLDALSAERVADIGQGLSAVGRVTGKLAVSGARNFATNFVADSASMMLDQAATGRPVTVGDDLSTGSREALGTAAFVAGSGTLAQEARLTGVVGDVLGGEGRLGTSVNGALGNIAGGLTADVWNHQSGSVIRDDMLTNAATGSLGNAANHEHIEQLTQRGGFGGAHLSEQGKLADAAYRDSYGTGLNTAVYGAGAGIESDVQDLVGHIGDSKDVTGG